MRKEVSKETLDILRPFAAAHPKHSYWVVDWTKSNGIEPEYFRSPQKAWSEMMKLAEDASDGVDLGADGHRVFIAAGPKGKGFIDANTVVAVWEDGSVHDTDGLFYIQL